MSCSYLLIGELNILNKANKYLDNKYSMNSIKLDISYEECYRNWQLRQYNIYPFNEEQLSEFFVPDFSSDAVMSREISEDLLYVQLNLLLAILICSKLNSDYINSSNEFNLAVFTKYIQGLISKHLLDHNEAYLCLQDLRVDSINKYNTQFLVL